MKKLVIDDTKKLLKSKLKRFIFTTVLVWLLFFLFNLIFGLSISADKIDSIAASKVWIYFYIKDWNSKDEIYARIINIKDELNKVWVDVQFSSKDDAFSYLEKKVPTLTNNFDKYWIENPLPSTLYVMFSNEKEYNKMKEIIVKNKDLIMNIKDVDKWSTLTQQENRSLRVLKILSTIRLICYVFVWVIAITIITFMIHLLRTFFYSFSTEVEIKKLLWTTNRDANESFLLVLLLMVVLWIIIWEILAFWTYCLLDMYLESLWIELWLKYTILWALIPWVIFAAIWLTLGYSNLKHLEKKM